MSFEAGAAAPSEPALFTAKRIGGVTVRNRLVRSATYEGAADGGGTVGPEYAGIHQRLSQGGVGLLITGMIFVSDAGRSYPRQAGLHSDAAIPGLAAMNERVHEGGARIFAQLCHGGRQTYLQGLLPKAPSWGRPDLIYRVVPSPMTGREILDAVRDFAEAALRAKKAGFDGVQLHGAHGYLISEFLSPFFNRRRDEWGGSPERRFRFLERVYEAVRTAVGQDFPVTVKINAWDHTPRPGLGLDECARHVACLSRMGIDAVEVSCGTMAFSLFNQSRGGIPVKGFCRTLPPPLRGVARMVLKRAYPEERFLFEEGYNLRAAERLRTVMEGTPLMVVGGLRSPALLDRLVREGTADFVSLSRPFIREPRIARQWQAGDWRPPTCTNCNRCYVGVAMREPLQCNQKKDY